MKMRNSFCYWMCLCHVVDLDNATFAMIQLLYENLNANQVSTTMSETFEAHQDICWTWMAIW